MVLGRFSWAVLVVSWLRWQVKSLKTSSSSSAISSTWSYRRIRLDRTWVSGSSFSRTEAMGMKRLRRWTGSSCKIRRLLARMLLWIWIWRCCFLRHLCRLRCRSIMGTRMVREIVVVITVWIINSRSLRLHHKLLRWTIIAILWISVKMKVRFFDFD